MCCVLRLWIKQNVMQQYLNEIAQYDYRSGAHQAMKCYLKCSLWLCKVSFLRIAVIGASSSIGQSGLDAAILCGKHGWLVAAQTGHSKLGFATPEMREEVAISFLYN